MPLVVLFVAHDIDVGIEVILGETALGGAEVLGDVDGSAVTAEHELAVQAVGREVAPHGTVGFAHEDAFIQTLLHQFLAEEICL